MTFRRLVQTSGILAFLVLVAALASIACNDSSAPPAPFATLTAPTAAPEETATTTSSPIQAPTAAPAAAPTAEPTAAPAAAPTAEPTAAPDGRSHGGDRTAAPAAAPTAEPTVAPAAAPTAEPTTAPAPTATPAPTPAPTPTPAPKPPGYHHGLEHGIAVVQTTRRPSETRDGWVDITLDLAAIKFDGDRGNWEIRTDQKSACFVTSQPSDDCLLIAWGSQEQFEADLRASGYRDERPTLKTLVYPVTFEVAANATVANLFFGDETKIPLNLDGDQPDGQTHGEPVSAPSPPASTARTAGFFMDTDYGVAVTGVRRDRANATRVKVDIAVLSVADSDDLALQIPTESTNGDVCFAGNAGNECLEVTWGAAEEFNARLVVEDSQVAWPQGRGWPTSFEFILPNNVYQATMHFGDHRIPIDSRGMTGQAPVYDYRLHYSELEAGTVLFDFESKMVVLEEVRQEETRDLTLVFKASNDSEAADFSPVVELAGARVTQSGKVVDGQFDDAGWTPLTTQDQGDTIGPGQHTTIELTIPRVVAKPWGFFGGSENPRERPDAALLQLTVSDSLTNAGTMVSGPGFVEFVRTPDELAVWGIWGGKLVWRYGVLVRKPPRTARLGSSSSSPTVSGR